MPSFSYYSNSYKQLAERIVESNGKCELPKDIHTEMAEYYRKELYEDMLKEGWDDDTAYKWCYGFDRWMEKIRKDRETNS